MKYVVTGAAGFIGSHLCEELLSQGHEVVGLDALTDYYDPAIKLRRLGQLSRFDSFRSAQIDLAADDLEPWLEGCAAIFHLAGQPGVRLSWDTHFDLYLRRNLHASQRLLEAARRIGSPRIVAASSSSVYGNAPSYPTSEDSVTRPFSPYGVTKLAMEQLCWAYVENWGLDVVALRYFTVYGPGQRPDMALHKFINLALAGQPINVFGDGEQLREFTYVSDVVNATIAAATADLPAAAVLNVAGGSQASVNEVLGLVAEHTGTQLQVAYTSPQPGDVRVTGGSIERAERLLGWVPATSLSDGIKAQVADLAGDSPVDTRLQRATAAAMA